MQNRKGQTMFDWNIWRLKLKLFILNLNGEWLFSLWFWPFYRQAELKLKYSSTHTTLLSSSSPQKVNVGTNRTWKLALKMVEHWRGVRGAHIYGCECIMYMWSMARMSAKGGSCDSWMEGWRMPEFHQAGAPRLDSITIPSPY